MDCTKKPNPLNWNEYLSSSPSDNLYDFCIKLVTRHYLERDIDIYSDGIFDLIKMDCVGLGLLVIDGVEAGEINNIGELEYSQQLRGCYSRLLSMTDVANNHTSQDDDVQFSIHCKYIEALNNFNDVRYKIHGKIKPFETAQWLTRYARGREFCPPSLVQFFENEKQVQPPQNPTPPPSEQEETQSNQYIFLTVLTCLENYKLSHEKRSNDALSRRVRDYLYSIDPETATQCGIEYSKPANIHADNGTVIKKDLPKLKELYPQFPDIKS